LIFFGRWLIGRSINNDRGDGGIMNFTHVKFLHVALMFAAVTVGVGAAIMLHRVGHTRDVLAIRRVFSLAPWFERISVILFGLGVLFGFSSVVLGIFNPLAPWLLIAYALVLAAGLNGSLVLGAWTKRVQALSLVSQTERPSPELDMALGSKIALIALIVDILLFFAIIFVMIAKPGGIQ
jgi:hypothetical protein